MPRITRTGNLTIVDHSQEFLRSANNAVERAIAKAASIVEDEAERLVNQQSSLGADKDPSIPRSRPGQPPFREKGQLLFRLESETLQSGTDFIGRVGTNLKYGLYLEVGTKRMEPRPYLRPALDGKRREIIAAIQREGGRIRGG